LENEILTTHALEFWRIVSVAGGFAETGQWTPIQWQ
jgi:hypothetical protein